MRRASPLHSNESSIPGLRQEPRIDQRTQKRITDIALQAPEPLCLGRSQPKSGHLQEFPLDPLKHFVDAHAFTSVSGRGQISVVAEARATHVPGGLKTQPAPWSWLKYSPNGGSSARYERS